jgi:hypothetical protein
MSRFLVLCPANGIKSRPSGIMEALAVTAFFCAGNDRFSAIIGPCFRVGSNRLLGLTGECIGRSNTFIELTPWGVNSVKPRSTSKCPPAEPVALRLLAPQRGLFATVRSKSKNKSKSPIILLPARASTRADLKTNSRKCQTATATPPEAGDLLTL